MISTDSVYNNSADLPLHVKERDLDLSEEYKKIYENGNIIDDYGFVIMN
jgi:hypothetical protein